MNGGPRPQGRKLSTGSFHFKKLDVFKKAVDGVNTTSVVGGAITVVSIMLMLVLFFGELSAYLNFGGRMASFMTVDGSPGDAGLEKVKVSIKITFPYLPCKDLDFVVDNLRGGEREVEHRVVKRQAYWTEVGTSRFTKDVGCTLEGAASVGKVSGALRFWVRNHNPHRLLVNQFGQLSYSGDETPEEHGDGPNISHIIHELNFGDSMKGGRATPLKGREADGKGGGQFSYHLRLVPTQYKAQQGFEYSMDSSRLNERSALGEASKAGDRGLGVNIQYKYAPILVRYTEDSSGFLEFITNTCAIVGGILTVSGALVNCIQGGNEMRKKHD